MGWASGSSLLEAVAQITMPLIPNPDDRKRAAKQLIAAFRREDCDTIDEVRQEDIADAYAESR